MSKDIASYQRANKIGNHFPSSLSPALNIKVLPVVNGIT